MKRNVVRAKIAVLPQISDAVAIHRYLQIRSRTERHRRRRGASIEQQHRMTAVGQLLGEHLEIAVVTHLVRDVAGGILIERDDFFVRQCLERVLVELAQHPRPRASAMTPSPTG